MNEPTLPFCLETYTFFDFELWCKSKNLNPLFYNIPNYKFELENVTSILSGTSFDCKLDFGSYTDYVLKNNLNYSKESFFQYDQYINDALQKLGSGNETWRKQRNLQYWGYNYPDYLNMLLETKREKEEGKDDNKSE